jgi:hypothetical protein
MPLKNLSLGLANEKSELYKQKNTAFKLGIKRTVSTEKGGLH